MNRHDRRAMAKTADAPAGQKPRVGTPDRPGNALPFPAAPAIAILLRMLGGQAHLTRQHLTDLDTNGVVIDSEPDGQGGLRLRARATKTPSPIVLASAMPPASIAKALGVVGG